VSNPRPSSFTAIETSSGSLRQRIWLVRDPRTILPLRTRSGCLAATTCKACASMLRQKQGNFGSDWSVIWHYNLRMASLPHGFTEPGDGQDIRRVVDTIPTLAWSAGPDGSADFFNQRWLDYTGLSAHQALGSGWQLAIHPEDLPRILERLLLPNGVAKYSCGWTPGSECFR
jgi:PAS domain-containing protein